MILLDAAARVPVALLHRGALARLAGEAPVRQEVRRVGEDEIEGLLLEGVEQRQRVALVQHLVLAAGVDVRRQLHRRALERATKP